MTKKLTVFFAVLTAICVVAAVPLMPFAIRDTSNMLISTIDQLDDLEVRETIDVNDRVNTFNIRTGNLHYPYIYIRHSDEKAITVKSDSLGYMHIDPKVITSDNILTLDLNFQGRESYFIPESAEEIKNTLARAIAENEYSTIEIAVPDGLILTMDGNDLNPNHIYIDGDVRYLTRDALTEPSPETNTGATTPELDLTQSFNLRVQDLRQKMLSLVRDNAQDSYDQLTFNMNLNDCRIEMEALLMEYAKENDLINYNKDQESQSSTTTGISGISGGVSITPFDSSVNEAEARSLIHELSGLYLSRLTVQAKLDNVIYELVGDEENADLLEAQMRYESQIESFTEAIGTLEDYHTEFIMGLTETGLLF